MHLHELHQLSQLIVEIGDCFMVRRTLDRLEAAELTLQEAIALLRSLRASRASASPIGGLLKHTPKTKSKTAYEAVMVALRKIDWQWHMNDP